MKFYDVNGISLSRESFVKIYNEKYFSDYKNNTKDLEREIQEKCESGTIDLNCIAWKFGKKTDESMTNGYGKSVSGLDEFLEFIRKNKKEFNKLLCMDEISRENLEEVFKRLSEKSPDNFGTVYIITVMFFLSMGKIPIYDKFAHKAIKAIYFDKKPSRVYVGQPPEKPMITESINMLYEYMWLLNQVFETWQNNGPCITREEDRALWTYGHQFKDEYKKISNKI